MRIFRANTIRERVVVVRDAATTYLPHHVRHSPDGHAWGYHGSGPAELARDLLWEVLGTEPAEPTYQAFKREVIATFPMTGPFELTEEQVRAWLASRAAISGGEA